MDNFKVKALMYELKDDRVTDIIYDPSKNPHNGRQYHLKLKLYDIIIYCECYVSYYDDALSRFSENIDRSSENFDYFLQNGACEFNYLFSQTFLKADFEGIANSFSFDEIESFSRYFYRNHNHDVLSALAELEESVLEPHLNLFKID